MKTPWFMCQVSFIIDDIDGYFIKEDEIKNQLPKGWKESEYNPHKGYVSFKVEGAPTIEDGEKVKELLAEFV